MASVQTASEEVHEIFVALGKKCKSKYTGEDASYTIKRWPDYVKASKMINSIESLPMTQVQGITSNQPFAMKFKATFSDGREKIFSVGFCFCGEWLVFGHEAHPFSSPNVFLDNARIIRDVANGWTGTFTADDVKKSHMSNSMFCGMQSGDTVTLTLG
jgi:hypothetical protein